MEIQVKDLKKMLEHFPDDAKVYYERIEDFYFGENGWDKEVVHKIVIRGKTIYSIFHNRKISR